MLSVKVRPFFFTRGKAPLEVEASWMGRCFVDLPGYLVNILPLWELQQAMQEKKAKYEKAKADLACAFLENEGHADKFKTSKDDLKRMYRDLAVLLPERQTLDLVDLVIELLLKYGNVKR
jgi:hypothetical protein